MMNREVKFKEWDCILEQGLYQNNRIALFLTDKNDGEPIATCTVNIPEEELQENEILVKEWSENEGMTEALIKAKIIDNQFGIVPVGPHGAFATKCKLI